MKPLGTGGRSPLPLALIHRSAWRNCLEIRNESRSGDCRAARRGRRVVYLPLLAPTTHPPEAFQLFSKQFRKVNSAKFAGTEFSEVQLLMAKATVQTSKQITKEFVATHSTMSSDRPTTAPSPRPPQHRTGVPLRPRAPGALPRANSWPPRSARAGGACEASRRRRPPPPLCAPRAVSPLLLAHRGNRF